jgi:DNA-binding HxlR family transcriptional regulator
LDFVSDRWPLLMMRDQLFFNCRACEDFSNRPESIASDQLSKGLKQLTASKGLQKLADQTKPSSFEYFPTAFGSRISPFIDELLVFDNKNL